jgi:hypothetical protein
MLSEIANKWKRVTAGLATATAVATLGAAIADPVVTVEEEDERPPIIVNNGSIEFEGDDGLFGWKDPGTWTGNGAVYRHEHERPGPRFMELKNSPNNKYCTVRGSTVGASPFTASKLAITFGTSAQKWTVTASITADYYLQLDFGNKPPTISQNKKRLTIAESERIYSVSIDDGAVTCTFPSGDEDHKVKLKIRQKR